MGYVNNIQKVQNVDVDALKQKTIRDFQGLIKQVKKSIRPNYEFILQEISFIDLLQKYELDNDEFIKQFYLNNTWQTQF